MLLLRFVCTFEYMGRPKKQPPTREQLLQMERSKYRYDCEVQLRRGVTNRGKRVKITYDTIKYEVGTMDRFIMKTMYIVCTLSILWSNDEEQFMLLKKDINEAINAWLEGQDVWDRKNKIYVFETPETNQAYIGSFRNVKWELHLRMAMEPVSFKHSLKEIEPLVNVLTDVIKKSCNDTGLTLAHRPSTNSGLKLREYVENLTNPFSPETAEKYAGGSGTVQI